MSGLIHQKVAIFGLGIIGSRVCIHLAEAGWDVACWSRTRRDLLGEVSSPDEAMEGASFISIYLKDAPAVRQLMDRIEPFLTPGQIVLNHATIDLETTLWLAEFCKGKGCGFLDAPFTGSKEAAQKGQLFYYLAGDQALAAKVKDFLSVTSRGQLYCGEMGAATVVKLATNLISACTVQAMAESLAIATHHGVSAACLLQAVEQNACASVLTAMKFSTMLEGTFEPHFSLSNMEKDSRYMLELAAEKGLTTPAIDAVSKRMAELTGQGLGEFDYSVVAQPYLQNHE
jgi:3-hydroxyisobutyrate dehydrogenase-like beta-hydroxyacid dehydrogenase